MIEEFLRYINLEQNAVELKGNKKNTLGYHGIFSSNWRNRNSFVSKWRALVNEINSQNPQWMDDRGSQPKFKEQKALFRRMGLVSVNNDESVELTESGHVVNALIERGDTDQFINSCISTLDVNDRVAVASENWHRAFGNQTPTQVKRIINNISPSEKMDIKEILVKFLFLNVPRFHEIMEANEFVVPNQILEEPVVLEAIDKYLSSKYTKNSIIAFLELLENPIDNAPINDENGTARSRRRNIQSIQIVRDQSQVSNVNARSNRQCELCVEVQGTQFFKSEGVLYNHVHHLIPLGALETDAEIEMYDKSKFMISLCPFHHAAIHSSIDKGEVINESFDFLNNLEEINEISLENIKELY